MAFGTELAIIESVLDFSHILCVPQRTTCMLVMFILGFVLMTYHSDPLTPPMACGLSRLLIGDQV